MADSAGAGRALARIPSGLFVLSAGRGDDTSAMLVSFVQQIGFAPPTVVVAVNKQREQMLALLRGERSFCLAVIAGGDKALLARFAGGVSPGIDPFAGIATAVAGNGVRYPVAACAYLVCALAGEVDWSDHWLLCGRVIGGDASDDVKPWVHLRKNGLSY